MVIHWTYDDFVPASDLYQGDLIVRTPEVDKLLSNFHSYFLDKKFARFIITSQSCDLARRRGGGCKAEHISLAVVRELKSVLPDLVAKVAGSQFPGIYSAQKRLRAIELLNKIINQNELARGLFYLHPDGDLGIAVPSVAMLRISIAVRSEHYEILQTARSGRLNAEFRNKLGWLCGNLYSRIATPDWNEKSQESDAASKVSTKLLEELDGEDGRYWIPDAWLINANPKLRAIKERSEVLAKLKASAPPSAIEQALKQVETQLRREVNKNLFDYLIAKYGNNTAFHDTLRFCILLLLGKHVPLDRPDELRGLLIGQDSLIHNIAKRFVIDIKKAISDDKVTSLSEAQQAASSFKLSNSEATELSDLLPSLHTEKITKSDIINDLKTQHLLNETDYSEGLLQLPLAQLALLKSVTSSLRNDLAFTKQFSPPTGYLADDED